MPVVLRHWNIEALEGLDAEAEAARDALVTRIERIGTAGRRMAARRAESDRVAVSAQRVPERPPSRRRPRDGCPPRDWPVRD